LLDMLATNWKIDYRSHIPGRGLTLAQARCFSFSPDNLVGKGGMSEVYHQPYKEPDKIAVKLAPLGKSYSHYKEFFILNEANVLGQVPPHANIPEYFGTGHFTLEEETDGRHFIALELFSAPDLRTSVNRGQLLTDLEILAAALGAARALAHLHDKGIVHADVKPDNILKNGKLIDFAFARPEGKALPIETQASAGTPSYFSLNRWVKKEPYRTDDLFAFGLSLFELFTGEKALPDNLAVADGYKFLGPRIKAAKLSALKTDFLYKLTGTNGTVNFVENYGFSDFHQVEAYIHSVI